MCSLMAVGGYFLFYEKHLFWLQKNDWQPYLDIFGQ
jgi:hypothetical protein